ncbi:MAG: NADH-quinone oxidoreductase subunit NuoN [Burkholderiaceae bacterium]|nr:NADH-quinone oxidoreductase subunit NuoN [Burkholderiaceae bacterium]
MVAPSIDYRALSPMLIVLGAAVVAVLVEAFVPQRWRSRTQLVLALIGLVAALVAVVALAASGNDRTTMSGAVVLDGPTLFSQGVIVVVAVLTVLICSERRLDNVWAPVALASSVPTSAVGGDADLVADPFTPAASTVPGSDAELVAGRAGSLTTEVFPLTLFATGGMMLFGASGDLLTMFIALEVFSLPLYILCGLARRRRLLSQEAALKYFLLGAFASAFFLFGASFIYGATGTLSLAGAGKSLASAGDTTLGVIGLALLAVGLLFKIGAVPFGSWVPDVYQGAPTPVTAFMASATKVAAFVALARVFYVTFDSLADYWRPALWVVAIATMVIATLMAVSQDDIKRMFAYSSIEHMGLMTFAFGLGGSVATFAGLLHMTVHSLTKSAIFFTVGHAAQKAGTQVMDEIRGLVKVNPPVGWGLMLGSLAILGMPPFGVFASEFLIITTAMREQPWATPFLLVALGVAFASVFARVQPMVFGDTTLKRLAHPPALVPVFVHLALGLLLGLYVPPYLDAWYREAARMIGG